MTRPIQGVKDTIEGFFPALLPKGGAQSELKDDAVPGTLDA
jgi:hypothetical protein